VIPPAADYEPESVLVRGYDNSSIVIPLNCSDNTCTFTMPAHHIRIAAVFRNTRVSNEQWTIDRGQLKAYVQNGVLYVSGLTHGASWNVYNILGTLVYQGVASSDKAEIPLPGRGVYIVVNGQTAVKVNH